MSDNDKAEYRKIHAELLAIATRLRELSDAGFADMEGADYDEFRVSEALYALLDAPAEMVKLAAVELERLLSDSESTT